MQFSRFQEYLIELPELQFSLDVSHIPFPDNFLGEMEPRMQEAFTAMDRLEKGAIANPDENRMVGHYWLRAPQRAPQPEISKEITKTLQEIQHFSEQTLKQGKFKNMLVIGIGGSALGPQLMDQALNSPERKGLKAHFFDNTDPDSFASTLEVLAPQLAETLVIVISKSGGTPETRNGMLEAEAFYKNKGLNFAQHAVAVTGEDSKLDKYAKGNNWIARFPMWDWVGGRTSELAAVGLLPAALQGFDIKALLKGAALMDEATRQHDTRKNPAALMALMWYFETGGRGEKDLVVLPYRDRLCLMSKYLQQLIMESLGKEKDLEGNTVHQGIAVYGNKGSTDQHAYVQQLREGVKNFFVTFIEVLKDSHPSSIEVEPGATSGDFLQAFFLGTQAALYDNDRHSMAITIDQVDEHSMGALIALFERAVGFYASLVGINAYHQPGVEAGKKAAASVLELKHKVKAALANANGPMSASDLASQIGHPEQAYTVHKLQQHIEANNPAPVPSH